MFFALYFCIALLFVAKANASVDVTSQTSMQCNSTVQCKSIVAENIHCNHNEFLCECDDGFVSIVDNGGDIELPTEPCAYEQRSKLTTFLLSFLVGGLGVDWFYLARENSGGLYIFAGIMKLITCGGCGVWWLVDWIRVLADGFNDSNGVSLQPW